MTLQKNRAASSSAHWDDVQIGDSVQLRRNGTDGYELAALEAGGTAKERR